MTALEDFKQDNSIRDVLQRHGLRVRGKAVNCPNPNHDDHSLVNASLYTGRRGDERVKCFACGFNEDVIGVMKAVGERPDLSYPSLLIGPLKAPEPLPAEFSNFIDALKDRKTWPFEWEAAKLLAPMSAEEARKNIARNLDYLSSRGDVSLILETVKMIRDVAQQIYLPYPFSDDNPALHGAGSRSWDVGTYVPRLLKRVE